jgi:hypothetical protein
MMLFVDSHMLVGCYQVPACLSANRHVEETHDVLVTEVVREWKAYPINPKSADLMFWLGRRPADFASDSLFGELRNMSASSSTRV